MGDLWSQIWTKEMAYLAGGVFVVMLAVGTIPFKGGRLREHKLWKGWAFFLCLVLGIAGSFMPGICDIPKEQWGGIVVFGLLSSLGAMILRKIGMPLGLAKLEGKKDE